MRPGTDWEEDGYAAFCCRATRGACPFPSEDDANGQAWRRGWDRAEALMKGPPALDPTTTTAPMLAYRNGKFQLFDGDGRLIEGQQILSVVHDTEGLVVTVAFCVPGLVTE